MHFWPTYQQACECMMQKSPCWQLMPTQAFSSLVKNGSHSLGANMANIELVVTRSAVELGKL